MKIKISHQNKPDAKLVIRLYLDAGWGTKDDYTNTESSGYFYHLYLANIIKYPQFTGQTPEGRSKLELDVQYPTSKFGRGIFYYPTNKTVDGRYRRHNRFAIGSSLKERNENSFSPPDAEMLDIKLDDGNPFKGKVIAYDFTISEDGDGMLEDDDGCTTSSGYNLSEKRKNCIVEISIFGDEPKFTDDLLLLDPDFGNISD